MPRQFLIPLLTFVLMGTTCIIKAQESERTSSERGYDVLRTHQFLPPDFDEDVFNSLWKVWPEPERSQAEKADPANRRRLTFSYYGLIAAPDDVEGKKPALGYVDDGRGNWVMNCLACHGGKVAGQVLPGLPNSHFALQTLTEDVRLIKLSTGKKLGHLDLATLQLPLSSTNGTTNAVVFGIVLGTYRNHDMSVDTNRKLPPLTHHDMDAPPFWNVRKKKSLYADGHSPKTPRPLMQFVMLPRVKPETLNEWESQFTDILAWIESLEPPRYPFPIDQDLARRGEKHFVANCSKCHGNYGPNGVYSQKTIPIDDVGTDPTRWKALNREHREWMSKSWMSRFGKDPVDVEPVGYVAPPLDGIWASAPYFHNGSVPTLWHVLHPELRPIIWKRTEDGYDQDKVGLEIESFEQIPMAVKTASHRRRYFNTQLPAKNSQGHTYPNALSEQERRELLEYLKTL